MERSHYRLILTSMSELLKDARHHLDTDNVESFVHTLRDLTTVGVAIMEKAEKELKTQDS